MKKYYFIYFYMSKRPSALEVGKPVPAIEGNTVIDLPPVEWLNNTLKKHNCAIRFYREITAEEYNYFKEHIEKAAPNLDSQH